MRHVRIVEGTYGMYEDIAYSLGDAEDWINRNQADFSDWADRVAMGLMSAQEMKRLMNQQFANGVAQIHEARALAAANARRAGFTHLHESLVPHERPYIDRTLAYRIVATLPEGA